MNAHRLPASGLSLNHRLEIIDLNA